MHRGLLTEVVQSQPPAARVPGRPERQQNDLICMSADLPESVHAAAQIGGYLRCAQVMVNYTALGEASPAAAVRLVAHADHSVMASLARSA